MKISGLKKKAADKAAKSGVYHIADGQHQGEIVSARYNEENDRVYLTIKLDDGTLYKNSSESADYGTEPLCNLIESIFSEDDDVEFEALAGYEVEFTTKTNSSKDGRKYSNIKEIQYLYDDSSSN